MIRVCYWSGVFELVGYPPGFRPQATRDDSFGHTVTLAYLVSLGTCSTVQLHLRGQLLGSRETGHKSVLVPTWTVTALIRTYPVSWSHFRDYFRVADDTCSISNTWFGGC
jgi:hypothetical protein